MLGRNVIGRRHGVMGGGGRRRVELQRELVGCRRSGLDEVCKDCSGREGVELSKAGLNLAVKPERAT